MDLFAAGTDWFNQDQNTVNTGGFLMVYQYKSAEELPPYLSAEHVAAFLGVSRSNVYEVMHSKGFPIVRMGRRMIVAKDKFLKWLEENTAK